MVVSSDVDQRSNIFREAGAAEAGTCVQEFRANTFVHTECCCHLKDIGADLLTEVGYLIDKADSKGQHSVGGVLDDFGGFVARANGRCFQQIERAVDITHDGQCPVRVGTKYNSVGPEEILDSGALAEKFRVGYDIIIELRVRQILFHEPYLINRHLTVIEALDFPPRLCRRR